VQRKAVIPATSLDLTDRQLAVLRLIAKGASNKVICRELGLADRTVKAHVTAVLRALQVSSRTQAAVEAVRLGLTDAT
jgi:DNA-binding NarL/FixJ family response regulator